MKLKLLEKAASPFGAAFGEHIVQGIEPLARFQDFHAVAIPGFCRGFLQFFNKWSLCQVCLLRAMDGNFSS
jgi:hypothetical protein